MFILLLNSKAITSHASDFGADFNSIRNTHTEEEKKTGENDVDVDVEKGLFWQKRLSGKFQLNIFPSGTKLPK